MELYCLLIFVLKLVEPLGALRWIFAGLAFGEQCNGAGRFILKINIRKKQKTIWPYMSKVHPA